MYYVDDDEDHLRDACNLLYDQLPWVPTGHTLPHRVRHLCSIRCNTVCADRLYVCVATGNVHICTDASCDSIIFTQETRVCSLTGNAYDHEEGVIFKYDNAGVNGDEDEPIVDERIADAEREHDIEMQMRVVSEMAASGDVVIKRRRKKTETVPSNDAAAAAANTDWATVAEPPTKKVKMTINEERDVKQSNVYTLAVSFLGHLRVDKTVIDICVVADACVRTWAHIQDTDAFIANVNKYQPHYHIAVMLRFIQMTGLVYGSRTFAPHIDELSRYITCPKIFIPAPFNVPLNKFTACSTLLRRCLAEKAKKQE